jgi:hypothetical protein
MENEFRPMTVETSLQIYNYYTETKQLPIILKAGILNAKLLSLA